MTVRIDADQAFSEYRPLLFGIAYRMLGSATDAEDIVQDAFVRWLQRPDQLDSPSSYLSTVVVRLCIDQLRSARSRREAYVGPWLPEPIKLDQISGPEDTAIMRESVSFAFLLILQTLNPVERAVFLLREVFDYDYPAIAAAVERSEANCRQIFHRARQRLQAPETRYEMPYAQQERLTEQFLQAVTEGDMQELLRLLSDDAVLVADGGGKVPAGIKPVEGAGRVARGMLGGISRNFAAFVPRLEEVNGQPAIVGYIDGQPAGVALFELTGDRIRRVFLVVNPDKMDALKRAARESD
jgi:RNA polymerase sigma-70 factor, ECF subfamily